MHINLIYLWTYMYRFMIYAAHQWLIKNSDFLDVQFFILVFFLNRKIFIWTHVNNDLCSLIENGYGSNKINIFFLTCCKLMNSFLEQLLNSIKNIRKFPEFLLHKIKYLCIIYMTFLLFLSQVYKKWLTNLVILIFYMAILSLTKGSSFMISFV